ncbi:MAG: hypothetical protein L0271_09835, partial [Gemmatimonadetes bacterium]|nr:hypothetical protein [Gemmatimonadota bacterium]
MHREALDVYLKALGPKHVESATARGRLARAVFERRRPEESYRLYKEAHDAMVAAGMQPTASTMRDTRLRMAQALSALNRRAEADSILRIVGDSGLSRFQKALLDSLKAANAGQ